MTRILVLEDDDRMRAELSEALELEGYEVVSVGQGAQAVERARETPFELLVTDIRMGGMDGLEVVEWMKGEHPEVPCLVVSGFCTEQEALRAIRLGVGEYLKKPFSLQSFLEAVTRLLERRAHDQQARVREQELRTAALWGLEGMARLLDAQGTVVGSGRLAQRVASELGLGRIRADGARLRSLLASLHSHPLCPQGPEDLTPELLRSIATILEPTGEDLSLEEKAALVGLLAGAGEAPSALLERHPEYFDETFAQAISRAQGNSPAASPGREAGRRRRALLSLARALEQSGQAQEASVAWREAAQGPPSREGARACLGLARLARRQGDRAASDGHLQDALGQAAELGVLTQAEVNRDAGMLQGSPEPLQEAVRLFRSLAMPGQEAACRLALAALSSAPQAPAEFESALKVLLQGDRHGLVECIWLLPPLLRWGDSQVSQEALGRLAREAPQAVARAAQACEAAAGRLQAVRALAAAGADSLLKAFEGDSDEQVRKAARARTQAAPALIPLRLFTCGAFEVYVGEEPVVDRAFRGQKVRYLLACLVAHKGRVSEELLLSEFWTGAVDKAHFSMNTANSAIRRVLRGTGLEEPLIRSNVGWELAPGLEVWNDMELIRESLRLAEEARALPERASHHLRQALLLYRGPYLENCYMDWAVRLRDRTEHALLHAAHQVAEWCERQGAWEEALEYSRRALEFDNCFQDAYLLGMRAYQGLGRPEAALRQFEVCERLLRKELGMEPSIRLLEARQRALLSL